MDCGVITIINIGLYLINQQVLHVVVGYVKENDTIDESLKRKLDLKIEMFLSYLIYKKSYSNNISNSIMVRLAWVRLPATSQIISTIWRL